MRVGGFCTGLLLILMWIFPSLRPAGLLSLGLFASDGEEFNIETVRYYDLANVGGTSRGWEREERILLCAPLRDAAPHLPMFFSHLKNLTYPHNLIDLAFLVGDSKDNTATLLSDLLADLQAEKNPKDTFGEISVIEKDFGQVVNQDVESRHGFAAQAGRRKSMAQARNWLLSAALRPTHSWVYWRDVDVETAPFTILEDLMRHNKDVIVPSTSPPYSLNQTHTHAKGRRPEHANPPLSVPQTSGVPSPNGSAANNPTTSTAGRSPKLRSRSPTRWTRTPSSSRATRSMRRGGRISPTCGIPMATRIWRWRLTAWAA